MNRAKAIAKYCIECSNESVKEVTLCHLFDCPLWPHRFGTGRANSLIRMKRSIDSHQPEIKEMKKMGVDVSKFISFLQKEH